MPPDQFGRLVSATTAPPAQLASSGGTTTRVALLLKATSIYHQAGWRDAPVWRFRTLLWIRRNRAVGPSRRGTERGRIAPARAFARPSRALQPCPGRPSRP